MRGFGPGFRFASSGLRGRVGQKKGPRGGCRRPKSREETPNMGRTDIGSMLRRNKGAAGMLPCTKRMKAITSVTSGETNVPLVG